MAQAQGEVSLICQQCSTAFVHNYRKGRLPKWCSAACANKAHRRSNNPGNFGPQPCPVCNALFERKLPAKRQTVCSIECRRILYFRKNRAAVNAQQNAWHRKHKDKAASCKARSIAKRPEYYRLMRRVNEAARRARMRGTFTVAEWNYLRGLYGGHCLCCGRHESLRPLHADHVIPVSKGGYNSIWNIQPLCQPCNTAKFQQSTDFRLDHMTGLG